MGVRNLPQKPSPRQTVKCGSQGRMVSWRIRQVVQAKLDALKELTGMSQRALIECAIADLHDRVVQGELRMADILRQTAEIKHDE